MPIKYDPPAAEAVRTLMDEAGRAQLSDRVLNALRLLDKHPGDARCRRRSYAPLGQIWGIPVRGATDDWLILWEWDSGENLARVRYIGPDI